MGSLLSAAPSSAFLCWSKWGSRIDTATANGALTLCLQGLCGSLEDSSLKSKTWVKWLCSKTRDICPMVQCHLQLPLVPYFLSLCVSILLSLLKHFHFRFSIWYNSRGWVFLSFFWYMKLPSNRRMSAELQYRTCMATWGLNIRSQLDLKLDLKWLCYSEKRNGVMRSHLRQMSWYFPQILLSFYTCDLKRIDITITGASEWSEHQGHLEQGCHSPC